MKSFFRLAAVIFLASGFLPAQAPFADGLSHRRFHGSQRQWNGANGQWGWGELLADCFDPARISVVNRARGGRSSRATS
jgi:hypothetical protein